MKWNKLGRVFCPDGSRPWMQTHASLPVAQWLGGDIYRIYFASRDCHNRSHVAWVRIDIREPQKILDASPEPVLAPGPLGCFDDHGVYPACLVANGDLLAMYYIGWNPGVRRPLFYASVGMAVSSDGGQTFRKTSAAPILARSDHDPCLVTSPYVLVERGLWRMWYVSGLRWEDQPDGLRSYYHIKYAESNDGVQWNRQGLVCIDLEPGERNTARASVLKDGSGYSMWYCYNRGAGYRIGYARSSDGRAWTRLDDQAGIELSPSGWDSEALAYPHVFVHEGLRYMLYNGNGFGRSGFGLAVEDAAS